MQWIKASDRLPEATKKVLLWDNWYKQVLICSWSSIIKEWVNQKGDRFESDFTPTHWCNLPEPPIN